jgi:hypothetical protein
MTTASLPVGNYLFICSLTVHIGANGESVDSQIAVGTAVATFSGSSSSTVGYSSSIGGGAILESMINCVVSVTTAGTLVITSVMSGASTASTILASTYTKAYSQATGYTIVAL